MENDFDGRKAVGANNRTRVFQYLDEGGSLRCGYHALGMSRPKFRKHARAWCEQHGQTMPRRGRLYYVTYQRRMRPSSSRTGL
jgi:hypothetical protein